MKLTNEIKELIKLDLKAGKSISYITKRYDVKKNIIRTIQQDLNIDSRQLVGHNVSHNKNVDIAIVEPNKPTNIIVNSELNNYLTSNADILIQMIETYKNNGVSPKQTLSVELPPDIDSKFRTTLRLNKLVYEQFKIFCDDNKQFTQKELFSQALLDFMNKHK